MFNKMIAQQTAKKEKLLDNFLKKHEAEYPFPEDVELICDIEFVLSIYKSGKQRNYPKPATVISGHSLRRYSSKLQQTVCKSDKKSRCDLSS